MNALAIIDKHIAEAEEKARKSHNYRKYMMYGYWKAIAVHLRRIRREVAKADSC